ncbi:VOC family protein [Actinomadura barringtoniae]|uniref:VOC family protein n=1 Tax=Actinomadura barringtoniae TaxID=1427535 RepID=A0A939TA71_9ACTN|nr:VOC family protein [Actinomadura barringtoniae]MBO2448750.1 VOC family protein [Actinomadura barringtoniae]
MELRWSHVGLNCQDPAVTEDFYRTWFGFERARAVPIGDGDQIVFLRRDGVYLELFSSTARALEGVENDGPQQPGVARHLAFQTDDLEAFLDKVGDEVPRSLGPLTFDDVIPGWRTVWFTDPDGVVVEVSEGYHD